MNTNVQTIHQMGFGINAMVKQATGRDSVSNIEHDWVSVEQLARYIYGSESGDIVSFDTNITDGIVSLIAYITAVQDLHGYDSPWPAGGNINMIPDGTDTDNGYIDNYMLKSDGTTQASNDFYVSEYFSVKASTDYVLSQNSGSTINNPSICFYNSDKEFISGVKFNNTHSKDVTTPENTVYARCTQSKTYIIQFEKGTTRHDAVPYSNICPISGWAGCTITDANMLDSSDPDYYADTYSFTFPNEAGTVYGGTLDVLTGVLTIDKGFIKGSDCTWSNNATFPNTFNGMHTSTPSTDNDTGGKSSSYLQYTSGTVASHDYGFATANNGNKTIYVKNKDISDLSEFRTHIADVEFMYDLRTPITIQLTPQQVSSLIGENNIYCSTGSVSVEYKVKEDLL